LLHPLRSSLPVRLAYFSAWQKMINPMS